MTPTLRKYHRYTWFFMAGLLPALLVAAIAVIPEGKPSPAAPNTQPDALPEVLKTVSSDLLAARLRRDASTGERQLEIDLKQALITSSTLVYLTAGANADPKEGKLLGTLSSQNIYRFNAGQKLAEQEYVLLFDPIKHIKIESLKL